MNSLTNDQVTSPIWAALDIEPSSIKNKLVPMYKTVYYQRTSLICFDIDILLPKDQLLATFATQELGFLEYRTVFNRM